MFDTFKRSWEIMKLSLSVLRSDKELLLYPILSIVFSIAFVVAMIIPSILAVVGGTLAESTAATTVIDYVIYFLIYLGITFIATFFNVCVVYTVLSRFAGQNPTPGKAFKYAFKMFHYILMWSLVSATVGIILRAIDNFARRLGFVGKIILGIITSILGLAWSILTIFVVPVMVYERVGPIDAIKRSTLALKKTWGESLIRHFAFGGIQFLAILCGIGVLIAGIFIAPMIGPVGMFTIVGLVILYIIIISLLLSVLTVIYNTALYAYSKTGQIPDGFSPESMQSAFLQGR